MVQADSITVIDQSRSSIETMTWVYCRLLLLQNFIIISSLIKKKSTKELISCCLAVWIF